MKYVYKVTWSIVESEENPDAVFHELFFDTDAGASAMVQKLKEAARILRVKFYFEPKFEKLTVYV